MRTGARLNRRLAADEGGMALALALLVMAVLTLLGSTFLSISLNEITINAHTVDSGKAFNIAEAGIEHARRELIVADVNAIFASNPPTVNFTKGGKNVALAGGAYTVSVTNNTPTDPDPKVDTDNRMILTSTGTYRQATRRIRALVEVPRFPAPAAGLSAYDATKVKVKGKAEVNGNNFLPPNLPCTGSGCDGTADPSVPAIPGVFFNDAASTLKQGKSATVSGNPALKTDTAATANDFKNLATSLAAVADVTITGDGDFPTDCGTADAPKVIVINSGERKVGLGKNLNCVGILIINAATDSDKTKLKVDGTFDFQGLILTTGFGKIEFKGTANVFGAVVAMGGTPTDLDLDDEDKDTDPAKINIKGSSQIQYSKAALDRAGAAAVQTKILSWQELTK